MKKYILINLLLIFTVFTSIAQHKFIKQLDSFENNDSLDLVIFNNIKIPKHSTLDSILMNEFEITAMDYFYYFASYRYLKFAERTHPALQANMVSGTDLYIPIKKSINLHVVINNKPLISEMFTNFSNLSKIKEIDNYIIENEENDKVIIKFIVNQNFKGTEFEISNYDSKGRPGPFKR